MAAPRTPGKGRVERTLADAPFGARLQGTAPTHKNLPVFRGSSSLTRSRQYRHVATPL